MSLSVTLSESLLEGFYLSTFSDFNDRGEKHRKTVRRVNQVCRRNVILAMVNWQQELKIWFYVIRNYLMYAVMYAFCGVLRYRYIEKQQTEKIEIEVRDVALIQIRKV
jgi:hypothetical protein